MNLAHVSSCTQEKVVLSHWHVSGLLFIDTVNSPKRLLSEKTVAFTVPLAFMWVVDVSGTSESQACLPNVITRVAHSCLVWYLCVLVNLGWAVVSEFNANNILWPEVILYCLHCNYRFLFVCVWGTRSHHVTEFGLKVLIFLSQIPKCWATVPPVALYLEHLCLRSFLYSPGWPWVFSALEDGFELLLSLSAECQDYRHEPLTNACIRRPLDLKLIRSILKPILLHRTLPRLSCRRLRRPVVLRVG